MSVLAPTLQSFFTERLVRQRQASPATVASYRDSLRLLLGFVADTTGKAPSALSFDDVDAGVITAFLTHLETDRHNTARTRNNRLAAIRALFRYAALRHPEHAELIARVLAIPQKRHDKAIITFLTHTEAQALLAAPDPVRWEGRRDRALLALAVQTGLRLAELTSLDCGDVTLGAGAHVSCTGKGRKQRVVPLTANTVAVLRTWTRERAGLAADPLPDPHRPTAQSRRHPTTPHPPRRRRQGPLPVARRQERHTPRSPPHRGDGVAPSRRRRVRHRPVARTRRHPLHPGLPTRRPGHQRTSTRRHHRHLGKPRTIQARRLAPGLPRSPVIMPTPSTLISNRGPPPEARVGIIPGSA